MTFHSTYSEEAREILDVEGPKYQYGNGCLSDGVIGDWMAWAAGLDGVLDPEKVRSHLCAVHKYNLRHDLYDHANPQAGRLMHWAVTAGCYCAVGLKEASPSFRSCTATRSGAVSNIRLQRI